MTGVRSDFGQGEPHKRGEGRTSVLHYGAAGLSVALALAASLHGRSYLDATPSLFFFLSVMVSAWYGGLGPGLLATALSTLALGYFWVEPLHSFQIASSGAIVRLGVFAIAAMFINSLNESQRLAQRKAEANLKSLQASEFRFRRLAESGFLGIIVVDLQGSILEANDIFLNMVGYTQEELRSGRLHWRDITPPESLAVSEQALQELLTTGACKPFEKEYICKDGSRIPVLHGAVMTSDQVGIGFALDISDRKQAETALRRSETRFQTLVSNLPGMVYRYVPDPVSFTYVSSGSRELVELEPEVLLQDANAFLSLIHPDDLSTFTESVAIAVQHSLPWDWEGRLITPSGQLKWIQGRSRPGPTPYGAAWDGVLLDITDRKQDEVALRRSEERFRVSQELSLDAFTILDSVRDQTGAIVDFVWAYVNPKAAETLQHPATELVGQRLLELLPGNQINSELFARYVRVVETGEPHDIEIPYDADGITGWFRNMAVKLEDGVAISFRDISDRKRAEVEREQLLQREQAARKEAETANRIKDEFLAVLSHELRSPLNPILGWSKLLQSGKLDAQTSRRALETIERNAKLQTQLIEDLLDVSRILRGKISLNIYPVNLVTVVESALETVRLAAATKQIQIQTVVDLNRKQVAGDSARLQQIVWNLLSNAVKFTPQGGQIELCLTQVGTYAQIQVKDTGKGISPDFLPYVFEYFRQEDGTTTRKFGGLGLGLAIVQHLTELHGGTVRADSPGEDQGATFTVRLPLSLNTLTTDQEELQKQVSNLKGIKALVVDDDRDGCDFVAFLLEQEMATVKIATSAQEAIATFTQFQPDILLSDIGMPGVDGYMLIEKLRSLPPDQGGLVPAIALTAYAGEADQQQALAAGFQCHIAKPVDPDKLLEAITTLLKQAKQ